MDFNEQIDSEDTIFHYTTLSVLLKHIGWTKQLKFGKRKDSRNPDEYRNWNYMAIGWDQDTVSDEQVTKSFFENNRKINTIVQNDFKVACFTAHELTAELNVQGNYIKRRGYMRPRMWSQYGSDHSGICLALSKEKLLNQIKTQFPAIKCYANQIEYVDDEEKVRHIRPMDATKMATDPEYSTKFILDNINEIFFMKGNDFRDESEFRIVLYTETSDNLYIDIKEFLLGILVGDRVPNDLKNSIISVADSIGCYVKRLWWENGMYFRIDL